VVLVVMVVIIVVAAIAMWRNLMQRLSRVTMMEHMGVNLPMVVDMMVKG
jgi:hypothetical protein